MDAAIALFVSGEYGDAVVALNDVIESNDDMGIRLEAYCYLGRAHLELGDKNAAVGAFRTAVHLGDMGPSVDYLARLSAELESRPGTIDRSLSVSRRQLAASLVRILQPDPRSGALDTTEPALERVVAAGWMIRIPDGELHPAEPVTRSAFFITVSRLLTESGLSEAASVFPSVDYRSTELITGRELAPVLERIAQLRTK